MSEVVPIKTLGTSDMPLRVNFLLSVVLLALGLGLGLLLSHYLRGDISAEVPSGSIDAGKTKVQTADTQPV